MEKGERRDLYSRNERSMTAGCAFDHFMSSIASPATLAGCPPPPTPTACTLSCGLSLNSSRFLQCCVDFCSFLQCWPPSAAQCKGCGCGQRSTKERAELKHLASRKFQLIDAFNDFVRPFEGERGAGREGRTGE